MNKNLMLEIVENIKELADELSNQEHLTEIQYGELIGYVETLSIIQSAYAGYDLKEIGLDFDVDKRFL